VLRGQFAGAGKTGGGVAGIHGAVAIRIARLAAGGAALGIRLADDNGGILIFWKGSDDGEGVVHVFQLVRHAHADVVVGKYGRAFGVKGNEIQGRTDLAGHVVGAVRAVVKKFAKEFSAGAAGGFRSADARLGKRTADAFDRIIVELEIIGVRPVPIADVGLVPNFPIPLADLGLAILIGAVFCPLEGEFAPLGVILGGYDCPASAGARSFTGGWCG